MVDIIIIGCGASGMTAGVYALRSGKTVLILESENFGGQIAYSPRVENFPSIIKIEGSEFAGNLLNQFMELGGNAELEKVESVEKIGKYFKVKTDYNEYECKTVIVATGVKHKHINIAGEDDLVGKGVSYCAVCDGAFFAGEDVALIGDGNTALQYSILLSNYCKKVYVCTLFDKFFGDASLVETLKKRDNVEIIQNIGLTEFISNGELQGLVFKNMKDGSRFELKTKACFIAIGQVPDNKIFGSLTKLDKEGYIIASEDCKTDTEGLFVAGDCRTKKVRQLTTACADGAVSAIAACAYIDSIEE